MGKTKGFEIIISGDGSLGPLTRAEARDMGSNISKFLQDHIDYKVSVVPVEKMRKVEKVEKTKMKKATSKKPSKVGKAGSVDKSYQNRLRRAARAYLSMSTDECGSISKCCRKFQVSYDDLFQSLCGKLPKEVSYDR